jgi:hypothetical protein
MSQTKKFRSNIMRNIEESRSYNTNINTLKLCNDDDDCGVIRRNSLLQFKSPIINITQFLETENLNYSFNIESNTHFLDFSLNSDKFNLLSNVYTLSSGSIKIVSGSVIKIRQNITPNIKLTNNNTTLVISNTINEFLFPLPAFGFQFQITIYQENSYENDGTFYQGGNADVILEYKP